jgi:hypothetical protein
MLCEGCERVDRERRTAEHVGGLVRFVAGLIGEVAILRVAVADRERTIGRCHIEAADLRAQLRAACDLAREERERADGLREQLRAAEEALRDELDEQGMPRERSH